jgi:integrase
MSNRRGQGRIFRLAYKDKKTGEKKYAATWWVEFGHQGKVHRESSHSDKRSDAVVLLKYRLGTLGSGKPFIPQADKVMFEDLAAMILNDHRINGTSSLARTEDAINHLRDFFGLMRAIDITTDKITAYIVSRQQGKKAANATINRELGALKRAFRLAKWACRVQHVPYIQMLEENNARKGFLEPEQIAAVLRHLPDYLKAPVEVSYATGWRIHSEVFTRRRHHVDLQAGWLRLDPGETKNKEGRNFPLTPRLRVVLEEQLEHTRLLEVARGVIIPWLFHRNGKPIKGMRPAWPKACKAAGVPGRVPHDMRRSAARNLTRAGVDRTTAMLVMGHRTESMFRRYSIVDEPMLLDAAQKLAAFNEKSKVKAKSEAE